MTSDAVSAMVASQMDLDVEPDDFIAQCIPL